MNNTSRQIIITAKPALLLFCLVLWGALAQAQPWQAHKQSPWRTGTLLLSEGFEQGVPPQAWTDTITNPGFHWHALRLPQHPFAAIDAASPVSAVCLWDFATQDEWLVSAPIDAQAYPSLYVDFYAGYSSHYLDYANLSLHIKSKDSTNWQQVWEAEPDTGELADWHWHEISLAPFAYSGDRKSVV